MKQSIKSEQQLASTLLMISPDHFGFNEQTAATNPFQNKHGNDLEVKNNAQTEFENAVSVFRKNNLDIIVLSSPKERTPDAIFPNNWITTHEDGTMVIYPMHAENRRLERQVEQVQSSVKNKGFYVKQVIDLTLLEKEGQNLEGTGSLVLDRVHKVAFAMESLRTSEEALNIFCDKLNYRKVFFHGVSHGTSPAYHTNVFMTIGKGFSVVCLEAIENPEERLMVEGKLKLLDLEVITISIKQLYAYCANLLHVQTNDNKPLITLSQGALNAFNGDQRNTLEKYGNLISVDIPTIEKVGGGSVRCLLAEIFLPKL